jgi:DNA-binding transcriptional LysR family regulator
VQLAAFDADEIDAGFVLHAPGAAPPGFAAQTVLAEPLVMALPESHPAVLATAAGALPWAAVAAEPLVIFPRQIAPSLYDAVLAAYRARGATPQIAQEAIQMQTIVNLVSAGMGLAWVPESVTRLQRPGVVYRAVDGAGLRCETSLVWRADPPPVVARFVGHVLAQIGTPAPAAGAAASAAAQQRQSVAGASRRSDDDLECS